MYPVIYFKYSQVKWAVPTSHIAMAKIPKLFQQLTYWPTYSLFRVLFDYKVEGLDNLRGLEGRGVIFASNHAGYLDGPVCAAAMPREGVIPKSFFPIRFLVAKEYFSALGNPIPFPISVLTASYVRVNGSVPVVRAHGNIRQSLSGAVKVLERNGKIWIYPEGKFTKDGRLQACMDENTTRRFDGIVELWKRSWQSITERRDYEWRVAFTLWTAFAALIGLMLTNRLPGTTWGIFIAAFLIGLFLCILHSCSLFRWCG